MKRFITKLLSVGLAYATITHASPDVTAMPQEEMIGIKEVSQGINELAFDLYRNLSPAENFTFSPLSISLGMAMVYAGAKNDTESAMKKALRYGNNDASFHKNFGNFLTMMNSDRSQFDTSLTIANNLWLEEKFKILPSFLSSLQSAYDASPTLLNFRTQADESTNIINQAINEQTRGEIPSLLKKPLANDTRFVLTNALYFNAKWASEFNERRGYDESFYGMTEPVHYMMQTSYFEYGEDDTKQFVLMPYSDNEFATLFVLPKEDHMESVANSLSVDDFNTMMSSMSYQKVRMRLPKFTVKSSPKLKEILMAKGLGNLFSPEKADLSGINGVTMGDDKLFIADVVHEAVVKMYVGGTTAAAATGIIGIGATSVRPVEFIIDFTAERPFYFYIIHRPSNTIMFMGHVVHPQA